MDFSFVRGLTTLQGLLADQGGNSCATSIRSINNLIKILREGYLFKVIKVIEDTRTFSLIVEFDEDCSDIQKDWILEIIKYYTPVGIRVK